MGRLRIGMFRTAPMFIGPVLLAFGCADEPTSPVEAPSSERISAAKSASGPVVERAGGSAHVRQEGLKRTLAFDANKHADGTVTGSFEIHTPTRRSHGAVTCLTVVGNEAWIGGVSADGQGIGWQVLDGGEGANASSDRVSFFWSSPAYGPGFAEWFCSARLPVLAFDVDAGNVHVSGPGARFSLVYEEDFEAGVGAEWSRDERSTSPSGRTFLGDFANHSVALTLENLPRHRYLRISFDAYILRTMDGSDPTFGLDLFTFGEAESGFTFPTTFSGFGGQQSFPGRYPEGEHGFYAGASEVNALGYTWDQGEGEPEPMDVVFPVEFTVAHTGDDATFAFEATGLQDFTDALGDYTDESWGIDNVRVQAIR